MTLIRVVVKILLLVCTGLICMVISTPLYAEDEDVQFMDTNVAEHDYIMSLYSEE